MSNKTTQPELPPDTRSALEKLNSGLLMLSFKREMEEPEYQVLGQQTFTHHAMQSQHTYSSEVLRVLGELKMTAALLADVDGSKEIGGVTYQPEDLIAYYSGVFFDLVHQHKDKLFQLVAAVTIDLGEPLKAKYKDLGQEQVKKFLEANKDKLTELGIYDLLTTWRREDGPIGITLYRRTQHHHFRSRLQLNQDFQQLKMSRTMLGPSAIDRLNEYGKKRMAEIGAEALKKLKEGTAEKQRNTIKAIESNVNHVAKQLIQHYKIPTDIAEFAKVAADYSNHLGTLKVPPNEASKDKIPAELEPQIEKLLKMTEEAEDSIVSIYLVGSVGRGEFLPGVSDINFYIITNGYSWTFEGLPLATMVALSEEEFLSEEHQKDRFICWSDGVLLKGKEFKFQEKDFPKPGTLLAMLLNRDVIERLEAMKSEVPSLQNPSYVELRLHTIKLARILLDFAFAVAMSNKPYYTPSRRKKLAYIKEAFPNDYLILTMEQAYYKGTIKQSDFAVIIDAFLENNRKNYDKMAAVEKKAKES